MPSAHKYPRLGVSAPWGYMVLLGLAVVVAVFLSIAEKPWLLQALGDFLVVRDPLEPADAIIAISGDGTGERVNTAATLIHQGYGRRLILSGSSGGYAAGGATAEMLRVAVRAGIHKDRILIDDQSVSTRDNATNSAAIMLAQGLRRAILVTSPYHTRRASWVFRSVFRSHGLEVRVHPADKSFFDVQEWWTRGQDRGLVTAEYRKLFASLLGIR